MHKILCIDAENAMTPMSLALTMAAALLPAVAAMAQPVVPAATGPAAAEPKVIEVRENGLFARLIVPADAATPRGALIALGGSEGGIQSADRTARSLAREGYVVLAAAYFGAEGLPRALIEVPIETFDKAVDYLKARPEVDATRIGIIGGSKGAEAALLLASRRSEIRAVVAGVPSNVVWQGIDFADWSQVKSSWSVAGKPMDFVPYAPGANTGRIRDIYDRSLPAEGQEGAAGIPVERIEADILLISAGQDALWPSTPMSERIERRLKANGFRFRAVHLSYPDAGHGVMGEPVTIEEAAQLASAGGTPQANMAARADAWPKVLAFLDETLRR
jgi:hypothetical protein